MYDLKPCPFCGGKAEIVKKSSGYQGSTSTLCDGWHIICENECCYTKVFYDDIYRDRDAGVVVEQDGIKEAAKVWNRRVNDGYSSKRAGAEESSEGQEGSAEG